MQQQSPWGIEKDKGRILFDLAHWVCNWNMLWMKGISTPLKSKSVDRPAILQRGISSVHVDTWPQLLVESI